MQENMSSEANHSTIALLEFEEGKHYDDIDDAHLPYTLIRILGSGSYGVVSEVNDSNTNRIYAHKVCVPPRRDRNQMREMFKNEIASMKSLTQHRHIIHLVASYTTTSSFGMIMTPVADGGDLYSFLGDFIDYCNNPNGKNSRIEDMTATLKRAFGCLADGLSFMHCKRIRHKDIKTGNILVHRGTVIYTDFGFSVDSSLDDNSKSIGPALKTPRYAAPEVIDGKTRDSSSDIFSLGCVYIEVLSALCPEVVYDERQKFSVVMADIHEQLKQVNVPSDLMIIPEVILSMTVPVPENRRNSQWLSEIFVTRPGFSCGQCKSKDVPASTKPRLQEPEHAREGPQIWTSIQQGGDYTLSSAHQLPFREVQLLGREGHAVVIEVEDVLTGQHYACKKIQYTHPRRKDSSEGIKWLNNAWNIQRRLLGHRHVVKLVATYSIPHKREVGIIHPVADSFSLMSVMRRYRDREWSDTQLEVARSTLNCAFGCLASTLAYMHANHVRHKDVKPGNILVHRGNIVFSGFEHSLDFLPLSRSSSGEPRFCTPRYAAPEILCHDTGGRSSDVYSLGCVFLEIISTLNPHWKISSGSTYAQAMETILGSLATALPDIPPKYHFLHPVIISMTREDKNDRFTAAKIATTIASQPGFCCTECREVTYDHVD
jgi:serine/threonine protein kinase